VGAGTQPATHSPAPPQITKAKAEQVRGGSLSIPLSLAQVSLPAVAGWQLEIYFFLFLRHQSEKASFCMGAGGGEESGREKREKK